MPATRADLRRVHDGMSPNKKAAMAAAADHIGALPDEILHHLLSFLPAQEAVRTCVLAQRWRNLWKFSTGLRIVEFEDGTSVEDVRKFVDHLLVLRGHAGLNVFEVELSEFSEEDVPYVNLWIRYAMLCKARELIIHLDHHEFLQLEGPPLASRELRTLDLRGVSLQGAFLDFSGCPELEDLKMRHCQIDADKISSLSLKRLSIIFCRSDLDHRVRVSAPCLASFTLDSFAGKTPLLEGMPIVETAVVELGRAACSDFCHSYRTRGFCGANHRCANCLAYDGESSSTNTVLLGAISNAKHLDLISPLGMMVFARDLKSCPTFNKLKTLLLNNYWCVGPDFDALTCILKHSPVLEKLTLQLVSEEQVHKVEMKGSYSSMAERPTGISEHLKLISVKYNVVDDKVLHLLKFLCTFNIRFSFE